jgi:hypothetical protein
MAPLPPMAMPSEISQTMTMTNLEVHAGLQPPPPPSQPPPPSPPHSMLDQLSFGPIDISEPGI